MVSQIHLLDECNLRCAHCYVGDARFEPRPQPNTETLKTWIRRVINFSNRLGFKEHIMNISGGEPTLRQDLLEILRESSDNGAKPLLLTNGLLFNHDLAMEVQKAGCNAVQISLEGPEEINDIIRGKGTFRQAMKAIECAKDLNFRVSISVTVSKANFGYLRELLTELDGRVNRFNLGELLELGAGARLEPITAEERLELYRFAKDWQGETKIYLEDPPFCSISPELVEQRAGCGAFICLLCVDVDGSIYPCRRAPVKMGTIDDLEAAWFSEAGKRLRRRDFNGKCGTCRIKGSCGGCRGFATARGDLFGSDTRCFIDFPTGPRRT
ncbi:MAG: radical SAM protein [Candidatus Hadarchaeaceae archaeon]